MPTKPQDEDQHTEGGAPIVSPSTVYSQPWWHGVGNGVISSFGETNGVVKVGAQLQTNGDGVSKDTDSCPAAQGLNGNNSEGQQQLKHIETKSPMELIGHSIDPHYAGMMTYGAQVNPHLFGIHQTRMPLPLQTEEEPVYVNAKQYNGILRRRQSRAKAELAKKVIKSRKPYLHESRHQHAMRRARGCGGRFLNTKKLNSDATTNSASQNGPKSGPTLSTHSFNSSGSDHLSTDYEGNSSMYNFHNEMRYLNREKGNMINPVRKADPIPNEKKGRFFCC